MSHPIKNIFIASEVRSGSTWVGELIAYFLQQHTGHVAFGLTIESFRALNSESSAAQVCDIFDNLWRDASGLATCKLQCASLSVIYRESLISQAVRDRFFGPESVWIVLRRKDTLRQAVSLAAARKVNQYHHYEAADDETGVDLGALEANDALVAILRSDIFLSTFAERNPSPNLMCDEYNNVRRQPAEFLQSLFALCRWPYPEQVDRADLSKLTPWAERAKEQATERFGHWLLCNYARVDAEGLLPLDADRAQLDGHDPRCRLRKLRYPQRAQFGKGCWRVQRVNKTRPEQARRLLPRRLHETP